MASETVYLSGKCKWARLKVPDSEFNVWKMELYPDPPSMIKFKESGMQQKVKTDEDGEHIALRRDVEKDIKGKRTLFTAPEVKDAEGNPITDLIGNGSDVTVKVTVYDTRRGKGHRLEAVRVDKLIPYERKEGEVGVADEVPF